MSQDIQETIAFLVCVCTMWLMGPYMERWDAKMDEESEILDRKIEMIKKIIKKLENERSPQ